MPLILNGRSVNKISGPISMYILTPRKNRLFPNLPVFMLFGDIHLGDQGMCLEKANKGVYSIYDLQFLSMLSNLTRPGEPIDFYVEGGDFHNTKCTKPYCKQYPMGMIWNLYTECYNHNGKKLALYPHKTQCDKIKNIRWQSADPRHFRTAENSKIICSIYKLLKSINFDVEYSKRSSELLTSSSEFFRTNKGCKNILLKDTKYPNNNADEELLSFINIILDQDGLVYKQLSKIAPRQRAIIIEFIKEYCNYIFKENLQKFSLNLETIQYIHSQLLLYIKKGVRDQKFFSTYLADHWESLRLYRYYNVIKYSTILDIYTICRCFKYLDYKDARPIMNIIYSGNSHVEDIAFFLEKITKLYTSKIIQKGVNDSKNPNRCVEITPHIDLKKIFDQVRETRVYSSLELNAPENKSVSAKRDPSPKPPKKTPPTRNSVKKPVKKSSAKKVAKKPAKKSSARKPPVKRKPPKKVAKKPPKKSSARKPPVKRKPPKKVAKKPPKKSSAKKPPAKRKPPKKVAKKPPKKSSAKKPPAKKVPKRKR